MGMEETLGIRYRAQNRNGKYAGHTNETAYSLSFYADDFAIACKTREDAEKIYDKLKPYLEARGLELSEEKARIVNISEGFNSLDSISGCSRHGMVRYYLPDPRRKP